MIKRGVLTLEGHFTDLVALVKLPYILRPKWKSAPTQIMVKVSADLLTCKGGAFIRKIGSGDPLPNLHGVHFMATNVSGLPFAADDKVEWLVTNTEQVAIKAGALRGDFYPSDKVGGVATFTRDEELTYHGVRFLQAFLIKKSDNRLYGTSERSAWLWIDSAPAGAQKCRWRPMSPRVRTGFRMQRARRDGRSELSQGCDLRALVALGAGALTVGAQRLTFALTVDVIKVIVFWRMEG